jgi:phosphocarrier protein
MIEVPVTAVPSLATETSHGSDAAIVTNLALARASAKFCQTVERFDALVRVTRGHETVGGTSIMGLMMLGAAPGTRITVEATGQEAAAAVDALDRLVSGGFGEED